jgi:hypothetical protein
MASAEMTMKVNLEITVGGKNVDAWRVRVVAKMAKLLGVPISTVDSADVV